MKDFQILQCRDKQLNLCRPHVMGILNVTPDSFSDGGCYFSTPAAIERALQMLDEGASIIDIGGESVRPGAQLITAQEEIARILPVLEGLRKETKAIISIDTSKPEVMREAIRVGADMINDVTALHHPEAIQLLCENRVAVCLMHMQNNPATMQESPFYTNVIENVKDFLSKRLSSCIENGMERTRIVIDPGFGFGKTTAHNLQLLKGLFAFKEIGQPILVGISRKFSLGEILKQAINQRLYGSIAAHVIAVMNGAAIVRVHDVKSTVEALAIAAAVLSQE